MSRPTNDVPSRVRALAAGPHPEPPAGLADAALHRARQRTTRRRAGVVAGVAVVAAVLVAAVNVTTGALSKPTPPRPATQTGLLGRARENVLLIGSDAGPTRIGTRPDTIILASIDTKTGATSLFSFPRNLGHAPFPAGSPGARAFPYGFSCPDPHGISVHIDSCLLNGVWTWAESTDAYAGTSNPGLTATTQVVEEMSGLEVDDTAVLTIQGLVDLVDAVGGVTVDVTERLPRGGHPDATPDQGEYYTEATQGYIEPGRRRLNGFDAMWFARSRRSTDDYDRMRRQRCLVVALTRQTDPATLATHWPQITKALRRNLTTTIDVGDLAGWVELARRIRTAPVRSVVFDDRVINPASPDFEKIRSTIDATLESGGAGASSPSASGSGGSADDAC